MIVVRGPWTEAGANFSPDLAIVREEVKHYIARELQLCNLMGIKVAEYEIGIIEDRLETNGLLRAEARMHRAYPGLLQETLGANLDPLAIDRIEQTSSSSYNAAA
jgi:hypothetical protein